MHIYIHRIIVTVKKKMEGKRKRQESQRQLFEIEIFFWHDIVEERANIIVTNMSVIRMQNLKKKEKNTKFTCSTRLLIGTERNRERARTKKRKSVCE